MMQLWFLVSVSVYYKWQSYEMGLQGKDLILMKEKIVDSTQIEALPSIKNREKQRDRDVDQKKRNQWQFQPLRQGNISVFPAPIRQISLC